MILKNFKESIPIKRFVRHLHYFICYVHITLCEDSQCTSKFKINIIYHTNSKRFFYKFLHFFFNLERCSKLIDKISNKFSKTVLTDTC